MRNQRICLIAMGLLAVAWTVPAVIAADQPASGSTAKASESKPLRVYPSGDMQGRRRWLSELLRTPGEFTDHQVAEFKANMAAMSLDEVQSAKYTDAMIKQLKNEVARMSPDEVRKLLRSWQGDSINLNREAKSETTVRQQRVDDAIRQQREIERAREERRQFAERSIKESNRRVAAKRDSARKESARAQDNYLRQRYYDPFRSPYWTPYDRSPGYRPYYGPRR